VALLASGFGVALLVFVLLVTAFLLGRRASG
jgi:hypothetical protein